MTLAYHLEELAAIQDRQHPKRHVPAFPCKGWAVLDVGCGIGQTLMAPEFSCALELHGIDPDPVAIAEGRRRHPGLHLLEASAETLPYPDGRFDLVFSRVSLPYCDIGAALDEMCRVLKPGGQLWITLHPLRIELRRIRQAAFAFNVKRLIDRAYVLVNSLRFSITGRCFARPWHASQETFQTSGGMRRALSRAGFTEIRIQRDTHFLITARKPSGKSASDLLGLS